MITPILTIARNAFKESIRQPVFFIMLLLAAFIQLINTWIVGFTMGAKNVPGEVSGDNKMLLDVSMGGVFLLGIILAAFISTAAISREIENKTVLTVVSKPVGRTSIILGKFLGISGAMFVAIGIMIAFLLMGIRHGILSTAAQEPNLPVILMSVIAIFGSIALGAIGNYFYGWSFGQAASLLLLPMIWIGYIVTLFIHEDWTMMSPVENIKPQIMLACVCLAMALFVMTALATAISTRLGQVLTITICTAVFLVGLLSNYWFGRGIYENERVGQVSIAASPLDLDLYDFHKDYVWDLAAKRNRKTVEEFIESKLDPRGYVSLKELLALDDSELRDDDAYQEVMLRKPGARLIITLLGPPTVELKLGDSFYYGSSPSGVGLITPTFEPFDKSIVPEKDARAEPALVITAVNDNRLVIQQVGRETLSIARPPMAGDSIFLQPTVIHPAPLVVWSLVPNMQAFWLLDAVTQNQPIPGSHVILIFFYGLCQITVFLSLAVILFQGRDVG
ncbi:MAG: ABC transporter permease [Phycisphaerales bacterium]|nr:ABC transporter permease [Phycisphaerales bacterium]